MKEEPEEVEHDAVGLPIRPVTIGQAIQPQVLTVVIRCPDLEMAELMKDDISGLLEDVNAEVDDGGADILTLESGGIVTAEAYDSAKPHYVILEPTDVIEEKDEYFYRGKWINVSSSIGATWTKSLVEDYPVRRKVV